MHTTMAENDNCKIVIHASLKLNYFTDMFRLNVQNAWQTTSIARARSMFACTSDTY